jgi:outer membrane protein OmpA-like peptidoglycan-associated protein
MKKLLYIALIGVLSIAILSCASMSRKEKGALIGATAGAVIGGVIGDKAGSTTAGVIMGAAIGGAAGAIIGDYMDKQAAEMERDLEGARIERVGEGIKITFQSGILFDIDKSELQPAARENLSKLAGILNKYNDTEILIEGHTDSTGSEEHNMDLSIRRANSVGVYLTDEDVSPVRFKLLGYGEAQPIASNDTAEGRKQNRRVEIAIFANDKLKKQARKQVEDQG